MKILTLLAVLVALFGERGWKWIDGRRRRRQLRFVLVHCLKNLRSDLVRIRDERNTPSQGKDQITFSATSLAEIGHYYYLFQDVVLPNLDTLGLPSESKTIDLFDHYQKNVGAARGKGYLTCGTVNCLVDRLDWAIEELGHIKKPWLKFPLKTALVKISTKFNNTPFLIKNKEK